MSTIPTQRIYEGYLCLRVFFVRRVGYFQYCGMEGGTPCRYRQIICNIPPLWDFLISQIFHRGGRFRRQILSLSCTWFVICIQKYPVSARVFLCGIEGRRVVLFTGKSHIFC